MADKVYSADVVYGILDASKIIYDKNTNKVVARLEEQLNELKLSNALVFKTDSQAPDGEGYVPPQGKQTPPEEKSVAVLRSER